MPLIIVTGGTTGAADGTLVSSGNPITFTGLATAVDAHVRCDPGYWSDDQDFTVPAELEISFDGGATWFDSGDNPITGTTGLGLGGTDIEDVNYPIKVRQSTLAGSTAGTFTTDGTYTAIAALGPVTGLTGTRSSSGTSVDLSWTALADCTYYKIERATAADFSTGLTTLTSTATATTYSDTGRTAGTTYYYRILGIGTDRYSDSTTYATYAAYPQGATGFSFAGGSDPLHAIEGPDGNIWVSLSTSYKIARVTPTGTVDEFAVPSSGTYPNYWASLAGNLWYTCYNGKIVKVSTFSGTPTQTAYSTGFTNPTGICAGPDGNLWVTDGRYFRKVNPADGSVTASYDAGVGHDLRQIVSDGTYLFASDRHSTPKIARCATDGTIATTNTTDAGSGPLGLCWDSASSRLYLVAQDLGKIYKITGGSTQTFEAAYTVHASSQIGFVTVGPDGRIYTAGYNSSYKNIYSMPSGGGSFTTEAALTAGGGVGGLCSHSNDSVWVCEYVAAQKIQRYVK